MSRVVHAQGCLALLLVSFAGGGWSFCIGDVTG